MKQPYCNDQAYIAEAFHLDEDYISQMARLASFKINSYKLSLIQASFCQTRDELEQNIKSTLLNYADTTAILSELGFFSEEIDN
ncbi:MAG TPA: hypothetical protein VMZ03_08170 [Chitinophagaceae bacterium]|nr:hypothetical protein [Chitinophagaceae bacterium]